MPKSFHSSLSFVAAIFTVLATAAPTVASNLLTPQNFKQTIAQGVWFVEHFSPFCPHCRHFEPTWNEVVAHFEKMSDPGVHLAQVNCALNGDLCSENGVSGYPQMNLYRDGKFVETFNADRELYLLVEFLEKHAEHEEKPKESEEEPTSTPEEVVQEVAPTPSPPPTEDRPVAQTPRKDPNPSGTVVSLSVRNFDNYLAQGPAFIKFFAPWCGHCKKLAPTWAQLGRRMQHKLNIAEVDCEQHRALCASQGVTGFPMLFYYANGVMTEYTGGRSYDQLLSFADKASNPTMQVIDAPELEGVVRENTVMYLFLHDGSDDGVVTDVAKAAQSLLGSPPVYVSTSPDLFRQYSASIPPHSSSALFAFKDKNAREPVAVFVPSSSSSSLQTWLHTNRFPSSLELSKDVFQQVMHASHKPLVVVVATPEGQAGAVSDKLDEIAKKWRLRLRAGGHGSVGAGAAGRDVVFTWMDAGQWGKWMKDMYGVKVKTEPVIVVADHDRLVYWDKDASGHAILLNTVSIASALDRILAGIAQPKHSRNVLERAVLALNASLLELGDAVGRHPYMTAAFVLGFASVVVMALMQLFKEDPVDWAAEKRYAKGDRLD